jgi:DNA ligase (NAD+)
MYSKDQIQEITLLSNSLLSNEGDINDIRKVLRFHEYRYYVMNDPLISDQEYDILYKRLEAIENKNPDLITTDSPTQRVGNSLNENFIAVPHLVPMLSLENSYNAQDLVDWDKRLDSFIDHQKVHFSVEPKFDGASISLIYENDLLYFLKFSLFNKTSPRISIFSIP